jgi:hypothetical protein
MKNFTKLIICLMLLISSCKKEEKVQDPGLIAGSWKWIYTWNDLAPGPTNPLTPINSGVQETYLFRSDYTYEQTYYAPTLEDLPIASGTFSVGHGSYLPYVGAKTFDYDSIIYYYNGKPVKTDFYKVINDTLIFSTGFRGLSGGNTKAYLKQGSLK